MLLRRKLRRIGICALILLNTQVFDLRALTLRFPNSTFINYNTAIVDSQTTIFNSSEFSRKEAKIIEKELFLEKQNNELKKQILKNEKLEQEKVKQLLNLAIEISKRKAKEQEVSLLKKNKELHKQVLAQKKSEIKLLETQNKITQEKLEEEKQIRLYFNLMIVILIFMVILSFVYFRANKNKNKELARQNSYLTKAQKIIHAKNEKLKVYNENLEELVQQRTKVLTQTNNQLINNNSQLEQFAYILAHNIKAPIARLIGLGILFKKNIPELSQENTFIVNKIDESILDLNQVVKDLNIILEIKSGLDIKKEKVNLFNLIDKIKRRLENKIIDSNIEITSNINKETDLYTVKVYLESIIYNLISNGIKYKSELRNQLITLNYEKDEKYWYLKVKDNGLGINLNKFKDKLFGLYKRFHTHVEGKGMGLYLVKVQVELLAGEITVESKENEWTEFTIKIPFD